jgi:CelD/BcsL family acetyltransferase involved in cellulose biosynthesis
VGGLRVEVIRSRTEWDAIAGKWNELLQASLSDTVFLTFEWLSSWADVYLKDGMQLFILTVYDGDSLVGVAPWYLRCRREVGRKLRAIECLGMPEAAGDYFDVFAGRGYEKAVADSVYGFLMLKVRTEWDLLVLGDQRWNSQFLMFFSERIRSEGKYYEATQGSYCPVHDLPGDKETLLRDLSPRRRRRYKKDLRTLEAHGPLRYETHVNENARYGVTVFKEGAQAVGTRFEPEFLRFLETMVASLMKLGWVEIHILSSNGKPIAAVLDLSYRDAVFGYSTWTDRSFDPSVSLGSLMIGLRTERAIDEGKKVYDLTKGTEDYKWSWANRCNSSLSLLFYSKNCKSITVLMWKLAKRMAKVVLR